MKKLLVLIAAGVGFTSPAAAVNIVVNGGFETGDFTGWTQVNDTSFTGVDGEFGGVAPPEGAFQAYFGPVDPGGGGIIQDLATVAGSSYTITFQLGNLGNPPNAFGFFWDGGFDSIDFDQSPFPYGTYSRTLTASSTTTNFGFIFYHEPSFYLLDDVSVELAGAVPEPATWAFAIGGFGMIGAAMRRRKTAVRVTYA